VWRGIKLLLWVLPPAIKPRREVIDSIHGIKWIWVRCQWLKAVTSPFLIEMPYDLASTFFATLELLSIFSFFREPQTQSGHHRHSSNRALTFSNIAARSSDPQELPRPTLLHVSLNTLLSISRRRPQISTAAPRLKRTAIKKKRTKWFRQSGKRTERDR
jgi:hypothetical protein